MQSRLQEKEDNLKKALSRLSENVSKARRDKLALENENHRMRIQFAESRPGEYFANSGQLFLDSAQSPVYFHILRKIFTLDQGGSDAPEDKLQEHTQP